MKLGEVVVHLFSYSLIFAYSLLHELALRNEHKTRPDDETKISHFGIEHNNILDLCNVSVFLVSTNKVKSLKTRFLLLTIYLSLWQQMYLYLLQYIHTSNEFAKNKCPLFVIFKLHSGRPGTWLHSFSAHSLIRGVLIQSCSAGAKNYTNYVFCHPQFSGVIQNIENRCSILTLVCLCRLLSE